MRGEDVNYLVLQQEGEEPGEGEGRRLQEVGEGLIGEEGEEEGWPRREEVEEEEWPRREEVEEG